VGELAYSKGSDTFYIGDPATVNTPIAIGPAIKNNAGTAVLATGITAQEIAALVLPSISSSLQIGNGAGVTLTTSGALIVTGDFTVNGTTTTVNSTNTTLDDNLLELNSGATTNANDSGIIIERGSTGDNAIIMWDESADKFQVGTTTATASSTGNITVATGTLVANLEGDVTGNVTGNVTGTAGSATGNAATATALATARTIGGTSFDGTAAIVPATITIADESSDTTCFPLFVTAATGALAPKSGSNLAFNSSSGALTATSFAGNLTLDSVAFTNVDSGSAFTDDDVSLMTSGAIKEKIEGYSYGDILSVQVSSTDASITGVGTSSSGAALFDLQVGTINGGTY
jgi:hypothetical protein